MIDSVRILVHEPTHTLVRCAAGRVQVIRDGRDVADVHVSSEVTEELALAENGTLFLGSTQGFLDLGGDTDLRRRPWPGFATSGNLTLHPNGRVAIVLTRAPVDDPNAAAAVRTTHARVAPDRFQLVLASSSGELELLAEGSAALEPGGRAFRYGADPIFAPDGEHWALLVLESYTEAPYHDRWVVIGRADRVLGSRRIAFRRKVSRATFDLERGTLLHTHPAGAIALSLEDGRVIAERSFPEAPNRQGPLGFLRSGLLPFGDQLVAVVAEGEKDAYVLHAFDPTTLEDRGRFGDVGPLHDAEGEFALASLGSAAGDTTAGLAWAPGLQPVVLVGAGAQWREGPLVTRGPAPVRARTFEPKDTGELATASPAHRAALAGALLDAREENRLFVPLVRAHPESFHPHLAGVLAWPDEWKKMLRELDWKRWPEIARGAGDALVDTMAEAVRSGGDETVELSLLFAADTPHALARIADLAREMPDVRLAAERASLEIPDQGPAVRRFDPNERVLRIVPEEGDPQPGALGLDTRLDPERWLDEPRGIGCLLPPTHLLRVPLELLACEPQSRLEAFHFMLSACELPECEDPFACYIARRGSDPGRLELLGDLLERPWTMHERDTCCPGKPGTLPQPKRVELVPFQPGDTSTVLGRVGGRPEWTQDPDVPDCPECGRAMFFVGQISSFELDVLFFDLFAFVCERCATTVQVRQNT